MRSARQLKQMFASDPNMRELIDSLWREYYGLYNEKYSRDPETWMRNEFAQEVEFGIHLGLDSQINANQSIAIGIGLITTAFRELITGSYAKETTSQSADSWNVLDLLFTIGNGPDDQNRSNAVEVFKSGLVKLYNALKIAEFDHGEDDLPIGTLQYTEAKGLQIWKEDQWYSFLNDAPTDVKPYGRKDAEWVEVAAKLHDHEIGNQVLIFESSLI